MYTKGWEEYVYLIAKISFDISPVISEHSKITSVLFIYVSN
jgi:hypothetical protein